MPDPSDPEPTVTDHYQFELPTVGADADRWGDYIVQNWQALDGHLKDLSDQIADKTTEAAILAIVVNALFPVGSIYLSYDVDPNDRFPDTQWQLTSMGTFIIGAGDTIEGETKVLSARDTGGVNEVSLTDVAVDTPVPPDSQASVAGPDQSVRVIPPYTAVYIWERVA